MLVWCEVGGTKEERGATVAAAGPSNGVEDVVGEVYEDIGV